MDYVYTALIVAGAVVAVYVLLRILAAPVKWISKMLLNAVAGFVLLFIATFVGGFFDLSIPVNLLTCVVSGAFGVPGVIFLVVAT